MAGLCNHFLPAKTHKLAAGKITPSPSPITGRQEATFGKGRRADDLRADDFARHQAHLAGRYDPVRLGNEVQKARTVFEFGAENGLLDRPPQFGGEVTKPPKVVLGLPRANEGRKLWSAAEVRSLVAAAGAPLKVTLLLDVICGFGNSEVGTLPQDALGLVGGWVTFPRPNTGFERRAGPWPATVALLR